MRSLLLFLVAGCTIDLSVGQVPAPEDAADAGAHPDALADASEPDASEADAAPMDATTPDPRMLTVASNPLIQCADSLGGREADFAAVSPTDVNLAPGTVGYQIAATLVVSGAPIQAAFQTSQIVLEEGVVPEQPPGTFLGAVPITGGALGPAATQVTLAAMFIDTLQNPPTGEAGFSFDTASLDGSCFVSFTITLAP